MFYCGPGIRSFFVSLAHLNRAGGKVICDVAIFSELAALSSGFAKGKKEFRLPCCPVLRCLTVNQAVP